LILKANQAASAQLQRIQELVADRIQNQSPPKTRARPPCLVVVQVGNNPASSAYIRHKEKACAATGVRFVHAHLESSISREALHQEVRNYASDEAVDGLIVQLPLEAPHLQSPGEVAQVLALIPPSKDADGLHTLNQGRVFTGESTPVHWTAPISATPLGVYRLLEHYNIPLRSKDIVVVGRSRLVGFPVAALMSHAGATITVCHRLSKDLPSKCRTAEILIVAAGQKHLITPDHIRPGVVIVDVGMHVNDNGKLTGDVHPDCYPLTRAYSPVPGGVGPMTVASLVENVFRLYLFHLGHNA
jgi:methylenetetrahydrofolate dehydrogenase (NADP+)/methenyltetrahydrofolate cyclohydrolase